MTYQKPDKKFFELTDKVAKDLRQQKLEQTLFNIFGLTKEEFKQWLND